MNFSKSYFIKPKLAIKIESFMLEIMFIFMILEIPKAWSGFVIILAA